MRRVRIGGIAIAAALVTGCVVDVNYDGSAFRCGTDDRCPPGTECIDSTCQPLGDAGVDAISNLTLTPFGSAVPVPGLSTDGANDDDLSLTADLLVAVFNSDRGGRADLYTSTRNDASASFPNPTVVAELSSASSESTPVLSEDGTTILFASNRPGGRGDMDIYQSVRRGTDEPWGAPALLVELSSIDADFVSWISPDLLTVVLHSNRGAGTDFDLYTAFRSSPSAPFSTPAPLDSINTTGNELGGRLLADQRLLTFHSDRSGAGDLFYATRASIGEPFGDAIALEGPNTGAGEEDAWLANNLCFLTFAREVTDGRTIFQSACLPR